MRAAKTKTEIRQEQIADAALNLMARQGPKALNLAALARAVGVVPSAIYRHYPGKEAVVDAVLDTIAERLRHNVTAVRQDTPDALERLHQLLNRHVQLIRDNISIPRVFFSEEVFHGDSQRRQRAYGLIRDYLGEVAQLIRQGQQQGRLRADVSADTASVMFLGLIHPAMILWLTSEGVFDIAAHAESAWRLFRDMLQSPPAAIPTSKAFPRSPSAARTKRIHNTRKPKSEHCL